MKAIRHLGLVAPLVLVACATAVTQDLSDPEDEGSGASSGSSVIPAGGKSTSSGGKSGSTSTSGSGGSGPKAFGGTATSGGKASGEAGEASGGDASSGSGGSTAGGGGTPSGGASGAASGGKAGSGGSAGSPVGSGSCSSTPLFQMGPSTKYAKGEKVADVCSGGTPCIQAQPPLQDGKSYEFSCLDEYNCGVVDPGTTNWATPPWAVTKACE